VKKQPELSVVIPCYNEAKSLPELLQKCAAFMQNANMELVIVDNGSSDDTPRIIKEAKKKYPFLNPCRVDVNQGYGFGILSGLRHATGEYLCWTHADLQTDPADVQKGLELIGALPPEEQKSVFVKGSRYGRPITDVLFTVGMSFFEILLLRKTLWDINAQPTMFHSAFLERWENPPHDFSLDLYAFYLARKFKLKTLRFPVRFGERVHGVSHWNVDWKSKVKFIKRTLDFSFKLRKTL